MISLLDASVLIALFDEAHFHHLHAHHWLSENRSSGWASCPISQNACIRIMSQGAYPGRLSVADITRRLSKALAANDHHFWADSISLCSKKFFEPSSLVSSKHLTDLYLLSLAVNNGGRLVTFDQGISLTPVPGATESHLLLLG